MTSFKWVITFNEFLWLQLLGAYSVSKTALLGLTKALAQDLAAENIRVNCVCPGIIKTKFSSALHESETARETALLTIPMRRWAMVFGFQMSNISMITESIQFLHSLGEVQDISGLVAFLASDDAAYITGENIIASGGMTSRL